MKKLSNRLFAIAMCICMICGMLPMSAHATETEHTCDWGEWTFNKDGTHTRVCNTDSTHIENGNCAELEWTYDSNGHSGRWLCDVCNGGLDKNSVDYPEHVYSNDTDLTCDTCGYVRSVEGSLSITGDLPAATVGAAYNASFSYTGEVSGVVFWNATGLPDGLTVDYGTGTISGTPTTAGTYEVTVSMGATGGGSASKNFTLTVNESAPAHTHVWSDEWSGNYWYHWYDCTAEGCDLPADMGENKEGFEYHGFDFAGSTHDSYANSTTAIHKGTCVTCGETEAVKYFEEATLNSDDTHHWRECACGHTEYETRSTHQYTDDADTTCDTCGYERTVSGGTTVDGVITLTPADLVEGASGEGWSFSGNNLTINSGYTLNFEGKCEFNVENNGTIEGGTFTGGISNYAAISGGTYNNRVQNAQNSKISGGTFNGHVENEFGIVTDGTFNSTVKNSSASNGISGGTYRGAITNYDTITGGTFLNTVENLMGTISGGTFAGKLTNNQGSISGITIELSNALIQGGESYGWSLDEDNKLILNSGITFYWKAGEECGYVVDNDGTISGGTFNSKVKNDGTISGGTFGNDVTNQGTITNGIFSGGVLNNDTISGGTFSGNVGNNTVNAVISNGTFSGNVTNYGTISGGTFSGDIDNYAYIEGGSFRCDIDGIADIPGVTLIHSPDTEWKSDGTNHWHECSCGAKSGEEAHNGGMASCTKKAVCADCGVEYGELAAHTYGTEWESDGTNHWHECSCGAKAEEVAHSGGTATCTEKAKCGICEAAYGELAEHTYGTEWKSDGTNHWHECSCGAKADSAAHSGGTATCTEKAKCGICEAAYGDLAEHTYGTEWKSDGTNHWHECTCGAKADEAAHNGGTASCTEKAKCTACSIEYGNLAEHTYGTEWKSDETNHWHECSCGAKADSAAHSGGTATCKDKAVCSVCGTAYGDLDSTNHAGGTEVKYAKDATCGEGGYTGDTYCKGCGEVLTKGTATNATGDHTYGNWKVVKEATTTAKGKEQRTCSACGHVESRDIPMISDVPQTGDESNLLLWAALMCVGILGVVVLLAENKRRRSTK